MLDSFRTTLRKRDKYFHINKNKLKKKLEKGLVWVLSLNKNLLGHCFDGCFAFY